MEGELHSDLGIPSHHHGLRQDIRQTPINPPLLQPIKISFKRITISSTPGIRLYAAHNTHNGRETLKPQWR